VEFHTPHETVVSNVRPDSSGRILRFASSLNLVSVGREIAEWLRE